jgi:arylsulfatase A
MRLILRPLFCTLVMICTAFAAGEAPPNIVLILADDLGYGDLGCYGNRWYETPALDRMAGEGMRFTDAYGYANCTPARAALLTGRSAARTRLTFPLLPEFRVERRNAGKALHEPRLAPGLAHEERTLPEALKERGYTTAIIGKWHLGRGEFLPAMQGFDVVFGTDDAELPGSIRRWFGPDYGIPVENAVDGEYFTDRVTREAETFLEKHATRPFFLYLPHYAVHSRHVGKPEAEAHFARKPGKPEGHTKELAAMLRGLDEHVARVLRKLEELKLAESTIVVFMSDNGGLVVNRSNGNLRAGKGWLYEGGIRVPLIVRWPGRVRGGGVSAVPVCIEDLFPTFVAAADGMVPAAGLEGVSLLPLLRGTGTLPARAIGIHMPHYADQGGFPGTALRWGDWKIVDNLQSGRAEIFNLRVDPAEARDRAADRPEMLAEMKARLAMWRQHVGAQLMQPAPAK